MPDEALRAYERAARDLHETELRIASIERRDLSNPVDVKILPSLESKRDRLTSALIDLKRAADAANPHLATSRAGTHIEFKDFEWQPAGTVTLDYSAGPLPAALRRVKQ